MNDQPDSLPDRRQLRPGTVYLVGAGPGDPELLTLRALYILRNCQTVVYDNLVSPEILTLVSPAAQRIYAGKARGNHHLPQTQINALLVSLAAKGQIVVRLKGGDPYIFGRGGEEVEALRAEGIPIEVVPGITAASGIAAYAGIPLTHRDHASSCIFAAGYLKEGMVELDWPALARPDQTVVIYMGLHGLPDVSRKLIAHGLPATTPAAIVQHGTTARQRVVQGTIGELPLLTENAGLKPPTLIVIGNVVKLREKLAWFGDDQASR